MAQYEILKPQNPVKAQQRANEVAKLHPAIGVVTPVREIAGHEPTVVMKVLTQKIKGECHHETEITIEWGSISVEDLYSLARNALVADVMCRMVKEAKFPAKVTVRAEDFVHKPSPSVEKYEYRAPKIKIDSRLEDYLLNLSAAERAILFGSMK